MDQERVDDGSWDKFEVWLRGTSITWRDNTEISWRHNLLSLPSFEKVKYILGTAVFRVQPGTSKLGPNCIYKHTSNYKEDGYDDSGKRSTIIKFHNWVYDSVLLITSFFSWTSLKEIITFKKMKILDTVRFLSFKIS